MEFDLSKPYCFYFNEICKIPHGSKNEKALSDWLVDFARAHHLAYIQDELWNVVIYKPASVGYESHPTLLIQAHMDMITECAPGVTHDFTREPLELYVEGDHLRAKGTTLGADDGMGCAYMLAILADDTLAHPALECCFTTQEEVGLVGAQALKPEYFKARRMINLDGAGEIKTYMSMGGGEQVTLHKPIHWQSNAKPAYRVRIDGLLGGHSGGMIDKERANAGKLMTRLLAALEREQISFEIAAFAGGTKHNVIMPSAAATIVSDGDENQIVGILKRCEQAIREEYELSDPDIRATVEKTSAERALDPQDSADVLHLAYLLPYGLKARNLTVADNPPITSVNLGVIAVGEEEATFGLSARSALDCAVEELKEEITLLGELYGAKAAFSGWYPGWKYEAKSEIREIMKRIYFDIYGKPLNCLIGHGGNECGVFKRMFPDMDIVTSGAIYGCIHTPDEFLDLASFDRAWILLTKLIAAL